jgi:hypothetical protein
MGRERDLTDFAAARPGVIVPFMHHRGYRGANKATERYNASRRFADPDGSGP